MKKILFIIVFCVSSLLSRAQVEWESQIWTSAEFNYNFKGPLSVGFSPEFRFRTQPFMLRTFFPDFTIGYKFNKHFSFVGHYRYQYTNQSMGNHTIHNSVLLDGIYKQKFDKLKFAFRLRTGTIEEDNPNPEFLYWGAWELREKFSFSYEVKKKLEVYSSCEFFQLPILSWTELQQLRLVLGVEFSLKKSQQLQFGLMFQDRPDVKRLNPQVSYSVDLDKLLEKKK